MTLLHPHRAEETHNEIAEMQKTLNIMNESEL